MEPMDSFCTTASTKSAGVRFLLEPQIQLHECDTQLGSDADADCGLEYSEYRAELEDFGTIGKLPIYQVPQSRFNDMCSRKNSVRNDRDSTGVRVYLGAHILIRFLDSELGYNLTHNKSVIELGCGTGVVGLIGQRKNRFRSLLQTDGNPLACEICRLNCSHLQQSNPVQPSGTSPFPSNEEMYAKASKTKYLSITSSNPSILMSQTLEPVSVSSISCHPLFWSESEAHTTQFLDDFHDAKNCDVVLGSELLYYRTVVSELIATVLTLTGGMGLFLHSHVFRDPEQESAMATLLAAKGWDSLCVSPAAFLSAKELSEHPDWYQVCTLVSGPSSVLSDLIIRHPESLVPFQGVIQAQDDCCRAESADSPTMFSNLFN